MVNLMSSLQSKANNRALVRGVGAFLLIIVAWLVGQTATILLQTASTPALPVLTLKSISSQTSQSLTGDLCYLMGKPDAQALQEVMGAPESISDIATTRLKMTLLGVIDVKGAGVALIQSSGQALVVGVGEEVIKGVDLVEVYADQVVISHRGNREKLTMEALGEGLIESSTSSGTVYAASGELSSDNVAALKEVGETLRKSPVAISKYIRFQPVGSNGNWSAVKIWPKSDLALFEGIGLQPGDLLTAINGRSIQEMSQEPSLWQGFLNESQFELTVERDGNPIVLSVDLN